MSEKTLQEGQRFVVLRDISAKCLVGVAPLLSELVPQRGGGERVQPHDTSVDSLLTTQVRAKIICGVRASVVMGMFAALTLQGCVFVLSHSYSNTAVDPRPAISESDWTYGFLHLSEPLIENLVIDLTHKLEMKCAGGRMVNVQTKVTLREFGGLFQVYGVRLTAQCAESASPAAFIDRE